MGGTILRILFMGTPEFAVPCLEQLIKDGYDICGVFTQPDKPKGRGYVMTPPPVKVCAMERNLPVYQPEKMRDGKALNIIKELEPQLIIVVAYGKILPKEILDFPQYGCINVHASLLPKYRGAAPIQWSVINGETETGVTLMKMDTGLDTGDMLYCQSTPIGQDETAGELHDRLSILGAKTLSDGLKLFLENKLTAQKQDDSLSCYAPMLDKSLCNIDWNNSAKDIHNKIRGLSPWPVAISKLNGKIIKIHSSRLIKDMPNIPKFEAGTIFSKDGHMYVSCADNNIEIIQLQLEGKKKMSAQQFLLGHPINEPIKLQ